MGSSRNRAWTRVPCTGRWILNHCATREVLDCFFKWCLISLVGFLPSFSFFFLFVPLLDVFKWSVFELTDTFFLLGSVCCWNSLLNSPFQLLYSSPPIFVCFFFVFYFLLNFSFCFFPLILLNYLSVFSYSSLSKFRTIILNSLPGNSCISISLWSVTGSLLCSFGEVIFLSLILHDPHCLV